MVKSISNSLLTIIACVLAVATIAGVHATVNTTGLKLWYDFEDGSGATVTEKQGIGNNLTINATAVWNSTPLNSNFSKSLNFYGTGETILGNTSTIIWNDSNKFTMFIIYKPLKVGATQMVMEKGVSTITPNIYFFLDASNKVNLHLQNGSGGTLDQTSTNTVSSGTTYCFVVNYNSTNVTTWANTTEWMSMVWNGGAIQNSPTSFFQLGRRPDHSQMPVTGQYQQFIYFNRSLSSSEMTEICQSPSRYSGTGTTPTTNFTITAIDNYTGIGLTNFSAIITVNGSTVLNYSTITGTITTGITSSPTNWITNITIWNATNELGGYFNRTYTNYNTTNALVASVHQSEAQFIGYGIYTNNTLSITIDNVSTTNLSSTAPNFYIRAGTYNVTAQVSGYYNVTKQFTFPALTNATYTFSELYNRYLNFSMKDTYNGTIINTYNITFTVGTTNPFANVTNTTTYTTTNGSIYIPLEDTTFTNGTHSWTVTAQNYFTNTTPAWQTNLTRTVNYTQNLTPYTIIRAFSYPGTTTISNFTINYTNYANTSETGSITTTNGEAYIPLYNASYNVTIYNIFNGTVNFALATANLTANPYLQAYNFTLYLTNTINFVFRDEDNNNLLNTTNVSVFVTGTFGSYNFTTGNGTYNLSMITPDSYTITYSATNYSQRTYLYTLSNQTTTTLTLYLLSNSNGTVSLWNVIDNINRRAVPTSDIYVQRKNLSGTNYNTAEICRTDQNGECVVTVELVSNTQKPTYRVLIYYSGELVYNSGDTTFTTNTQTFEINIASRPLQELFQISGSYFSLTENHSTTAATFNYTFVDTYSVIASNCMVVSYRNYALTTNLYSACSSADSGLLTTTVALQGQEVCARAYTISNSGLTIGTSIKCISNTRNTSAPGAKGLFYIVLPLFVTFIIIFRAKPGLAIAGSGIVLVTTFFIGLLDAPSAVVGGILIVAAIIYLSNKT